MVSVFPDNPIDLPFHNALVKRNLKRFLPEGFGFFTRNPREERISIFQFCREGNFKEIHLQNATFDNILGLKKNSRALNALVQSILNNTKDSLWTDCFGDLELCVNNIPLKQKSIIPSVYQFQCGKYIAIRFKPIPWAWFKSYQKLSYPDYKVLIIEIVCHS